MGQSAPAAASYPESAAAGTLAVQTLAWSCTATWLVFASPLTGGRLGAAAVELAGTEQTLVYNFRSDGQEFTSNRCLIVADGSYEFTEPKEPGKRRKDKWLFTRKDGPLVCIAGILRDPENRS